MAHVNMASVVSKATEMFHEVWIIPTATSLDKALVVMSAARRAAELRNHFAERFDPTNTMRELPVAEPVKAKRKSRGPSSFSQRDVTRALRAQRKAGVSRGRIVIERATGNIVIETGKPEPVELAPGEAVNEWDTPL